MTNDDRRTLVVSVGADAGENCLMCDAIDNTVTTAKYAVIDKISWVISMGLCRKHAMTMRASHWEGDDVHGFWLEARE